MREFFINLLILFIVAAMLTLTCVALVDAWDKESDIREAKAKAIVAQGAIQ